MRFIGFAAVALVLAACQTTQRAPNPVGYDVLAEYYIAETVVEIAPGATVRWGNAEAQYAATQNCFLASPNNNADRDAPVNPARNTDCDYNAVIESPEAEAYLHQRITDHMEDAVDLHYANALAGDKPARLKVRVQALNVVSGGQAVLVGGAHYMAASFALENQETGNTIVSPEQFEETGGYAPGGLLAVIVEAASDPAPLRMAKGLAEKSRIWMLGQAPQDQAVGAAGQKAAASAPPEQIIPPKDGKYTIVLEQSGTPSKHEWCQAGEGYTGTVEVTGSTVKSSSITSSQGSDGSLVGSKASNGGLRLQLAAVQSGLSYAKWHTTVRQTGQAWVGSGLINAGYGYCSMDFRLTPLSPE